MKYRRTLLTASEIRDYIKTGVKYAMINNRIFDNFYERDDLYYHPLIERYPGEGAIYIDHDTKIPTKFTDLDMLVFILIKFMNINQISLYESEMAIFLNCSVRHLKESLERLKLLRGEAMKIVTSYDDNGKRTESIKMREVPLISHQINRKVRSADPVSEWYTEYDHDYKKVDGEFVGINFFIVTIDDLDFLLMHKMMKTRYEFILYLFFIRTHTERENMENKKPFYMKNETIANKLHIKGVHTTLNKYIENLESNGFIEIRFPQNYERRMFARQETSREFIPIANLQTLVKYKLDSVVVGITENSISLEISGT